MVDTATRLHATFSSDLSAPTLETPSSLADTVRRKSSKSSLVPAPCISQTRFLFVDALRGVACLAVMFFHLQGNTVMALPLTRLLPTVISRTLNHGCLGVEVFFVISGFVIAHSLRNFVPSAGFVGRFILRRQLRLDPAFWFALALTLGLLLAENRLPAVVHKAAPTVRQVAANALYVQSILNIPRILDVSWTLCIEVQFYLVFIFFLWGCSSISRMRANSVVTPTLMCILGLISLIASHWITGRSWFVPLWFYFAAGVTCYWASVGNGAGAWAFAVLIAAMTAEALLERSSAVVVGILTAGAIFLAAKSGGLMRWSGGPVLQYFGRISYSLYLIHVPVLMTVLRAAYKLTHDNRWAALGWTLLTTALCVIAAHLMYTRIERPAMQLASRLKMP